MILENQHNISLSATQIADVAAVLDAYRTWKGFAFLTMADLVLFISKPSPERDEFLATLNVTVKVVKTDFATQTVE
jgi:hypothetical protein